MRASYDFSNAKKNPYAKKLKKEKINLQKPEILLQERNIKFLIAT